MDIDLSTLQASRLARAKALGIPTPTICSDCDGTGMHKNLSSGEYERHTCSTCKGSGVKREISGAQLMALFNGNPHALNPPSTDPIVVAIKRSIGWED